MTNRTSTPWNEQDQLEVLTFDLHNETFALEAVLVREILDLLHETAVPGAEPLVGSVVNFRGKIIPIADLRLAFGMPAAEKTVESRIVVIELEVNDEMMQVGIRTDRVNEVTTLQRAASEEPPAVGMRWRREYVRELVRRDAGVIVLPDLPAIFETSIGAVGAPASL